MAATTPPPPPASPGPSVAGSGNVAVGTATTGATGSTVNANVQSGSDVPEDRVALAETYEEKTVAELRELIDQRNESRPEDDRISKGGKQEELVARLREDDERAAEDPERVTPPEALQGDTAVYPTGTDSAVLKPFQTEGENPADREAAERQEAEAHSREELLRRETQQVPLLRDYNPNPE